MCIRDRVDVVLLHSFGGQRAVIDANTIQIKIRVVIAKRYLSIVLEVVIIQVSVLPVLLPINIDGNQVEVRITVCVRHHHHCQANTYTCLLYTSRCV